MHSYEIILKNEKEKTYRSISWLILNVNFITIILLAFATNFKEIIPVILAILAITSILTFKYLKKTGIKKKFSVPFLLFTFAWLFTGYWWMGIVNFIFFILDASTSGKLKVLFYEDQILFPSLVSRTVHWKDLANVILKDGILTIDFKNNRIIQQYIEEAGPAVDEKKFNEFCRQQLENTNKIK